MSEVTQGEARILAASILGLDPADVAGAVTIAIMTDGSAGVNSTGPCLCWTLEALSAAVARIAKGIHLGEISRDDR